MFGRSDGRGGDDVDRCLAYDAVLGPFLGLPEPQKLAFLRWLIDGLRKSLRCLKGQDELA